MGNWACFVEDGDDLAMGRWQMEENLENAMGMTKEQKRWIVLNASVDTGGYL
jgi:hypothetical protein